MADVEVTADGWTVASVDYDFFRLLTNHSPPRPAGYWFWLKRDARGFKPVGLWVLAGGLIALALTTGWHYFLTAGLFLLAFYVYMFLQTVNYFRNCPVEVGRIANLTDALSPHLLFQNCRVATAAMADGRDVPIVLTTGLVSDLPAQCPAEVLFIHDSSPQFRSKEPKFSIVIAARSARVPMLQSAPGR